MLSSVFICLLPSSQQQYYTGTTVSAPLAEDIFIHSYILQERPIKIHYITCIYRELWAHFIHYPCFIAVDCSPSYVDEGCDLEAVCNRMVWTKYKNAGQTCISVDYVLVKDSVEVSL